MRQKKICFRFDVDTHKCAKVGMPRLLDLAKAKDVKLTFFVNCGQSIHLFESIKALFNKKPSLASASFPQLGARRKLGNLEYLRCALLNPQIVNYARDAIRRAHAEGHEIGLHGGRNHELWGRFVDHWSEDQIRSEIQWGLDQLGQLDIKPSVFASPCAVGGDRVRKILSETGKFKFVSDDLNPDSLSPKPVSAGILDIPTSLCGQGGVAYIEQLVAQNLNPDQIVQHFENRLRDLKAAVFYDHPYFAGDEALPIMGSLIDCAKKNGFQITSLSEIGHYYESENHIRRQSP